jgi:flagellar biosynthesis protein FlhB
MDSAQDRNLPATPHKLDQARKDGQAARSKDLSNLAALGAGAGAILTLSPMVFDRLKMGLAQLLRFDAALLAQPQAMFARAQDVVLVGVLVSLGFALATAMAVVLGTVASGGWIMSSKPLMPNFGRLNPIAGFGNLFTKAQLANVLKLVFLTVVLCTVSYVFLSNNIHKVMAMAQQPSHAALRDIGGWLVSGISLLLLVVFAAAVVDVPLQGFLFKSRLKMSHEEVKQEHKNTEGNPHIKGKLRQRQREISQRRSIASVPKADFVVMNPTHFAVAIKYDEQTMNAPQVISKGADVLAMKIREVATMHSIPVLQSPMLARALYAHAELDQPIPATLYTAVAQVLAYVYRLKAALRGHGPAPGAQPEPFVPPELDPLNPSATGAQAL